MTPLLAIDLGTTTGWAVRGADGTVRHGSARLGMKGDSQGERFRNFRFWLDTTSPVGYRGPIEVAHEAPHLRGKDATELLCGMRGILHAHAATNRWNIRDVHSGTLKKHATGDGRAKKKQMVAHAEALLTGGAIECGEARPWYVDPCTCRETGCPGVADDNEADAIAVLRWLADEVDATSPPISAPYLAP